MTFMIRTILSAAALSLVCSAAHAQSLINPCGAQFTLCQGKSLSLSSASNVYVISVPPNYASVMLQITGLTGSGATITPKIAADWNGATGTFKAVAFTVVSGATVTNPTSATTDGLYTIAAGQAVELAVTTAGTGSALVSYALSAAAPAGAAASISGSVTSNQGNAGSSAWLTTPAPSTLTYQSTPNANVGTTSATLTINSLDFNSANFKTMQLCTALTSTSNVYINPTGGTAVVGQNIYVASGGGCANFGTAALPMPTASATAITDSSSAQALLASGG